MSFDFIFIAFATLGSPPRGTTMRNTRKDFSFAPLCHNGLIYTADLGLWSKVDLVPDSESKTFCPQKQDILSALKQSQSEDWYFLMALTEHGEFDSPGSPSTRLHLELALTLIQEAKVSDLIELGFDILDQWSGLSALINVGYSMSDVAALEKLELKTNHFGLFDKVDDSFKFSEFATNAIPEHAPFIPLKIFARLPAKWPVSGTLR